MYMCVRCLCVLYVGFFFLDDGMGKPGWTGLDWIGLDYLLTYLGKKKRFMWFLLFCFYLNLWVREPGGGGTITIYIYIDKDIPSRVLFR